MSSAFACPHCRNVIQPAHPVPAGKQVKCPFCQGYFLAPVTSPLPVAEVVLPMPAIPVAGMSPPPSMPPIPVAGISPPPIPHRKHKKHKKRHKHRHRHGEGATPSRNGLLKILVAAGIVLALVGAGAGAFLFFGPGPGRSVASRSSAEEEETAPTETKGDATDPGTKPSVTQETKVRETKTVEKKTKKISPKGPEDPLVLVPPDSALIMGGNIKPLAEVPAFKGLIAGPLAKFSAELKRDTGIELAEFESATVAVHGPPADLGAVKSTLILKSQAAFDVDKLAVSPAIAAAVEVKGKTYFKLKPDSGLAGGKPDAQLLIPSNRLLVVSDLPTAELEKLIGGDLAKPPFARNHLEVIRELEKQPLWAFITLADDVKKQLQAGLMVDQAPEALAAPVKALAGAAALVVFAAPGEDAVQVAAGLICADDTAAQEVVAGLTAYWKLLKMPGGLMAKLPPAVAKLAGELRAGVEFNQKGPMALATVMLPLAPLAELVAGGEAEVKAAFPQLLAGLAPPPPFTLSKEEQAVLDLTNKAREDAKLPPLKINPLLMKMAREHAANMAKQDKADDLLDGKDHAARLSDAGYKIKDKMSQANLVSAGAAVLSPKVAVDAWLGDQAAKGNILGKYEEIGIAIAISAKKIAYYYQVFAVPEE